MRKSFVSLSDSYLLKAANSGGKNVLRNLDVEKFVIALYVNSSLLIQNKGYEVQFDKFTMKSQELFQLTHNLAKQMNHPAIDSLHTTSNVGSRLFLEGRSAGISQKDVDQGVEQALKEAFQPDWQWT